MFTPLLLARTEARTDDFPSRAGVCGGLQGAREKHEFEDFLGRGVEGDGEWWGGEGEVQREDVEAEDLGAGVGELVQGGAVGEGDERAGGVEGVG